MARQVIRDCFNRVVGWREAEGERVKGCDFLGRIKGWYYPRANITRDNFNRIVGKGDRLTELILAP